MKFLASIDIMPQKEILDPQGKAIHSALVNHGFNHVLDIRQGKIIDINMNCSDIEQVKNDIQAMCEKLLANTVIENYEILEIIET